MGKLRQESIEKVARLSVFDEFFRCLYDSHNA
jgi:hypothetical protein